MLRRVNLWVILTVWLVGMSAHCVYYVSLTLSHTSEMHEWYANSHRFQVLAFLMVRVPMWLWVLAIVLAARVPSKGGRLTTRSSGP